MGKAFTPEEKTAIKIKLMETALELFHDQGVKTLNIRELTKRAGIAQGTFYRFWEDKDALVLDVMKYRARQKLDAVIPHFPDSLADPAGFLSRQIYDWCMDLKEKVDTQPLYKQSMTLLRRQSEEDVNRVSAIYCEFLQQLADYWIQNGATQKVDVSGLLNVFIGVSVLFADAAQFDRDYFDRIFFTFIESGIRQFLVI